MFGATCYHDLAAFLINKLYSITNKITPCARTAAQKQSIFFSFLHFIYKQCLRVLNNIADVIKIFVIKRNKFKKDVLIGHEAHSSCMLPVLVCNKSFAGKISFNICNGLA